jgi:hypothetical protein
MSRESRLTIPQAAAWAAILVMLVNIYIDGGFNVYWIYQKSIDFYDFSVSIIKWVAINIMS